jgi:hypothetical protein
MTTKTYTHVSRFTIRAKCPHLTQALIILLYSLILQEANITAHEYNIAQYIKALNSRILFSSCAYFRQIYEDTALQH